MSGEDRRQNEFLLKELVASPVSAAGVFGFAAITVLGTPTLSRKEFFGYRS